MLLLSLKWEVELIQLWNMNVKKRLRAITVFVCSLNYVVFKSV